MVKRRQRRARGLTLIEVMVALLITTVALLGALATVGITVRGANFSRNATEASVLVQTKLESLVSLPVGTTSGSLPGNTTEAPSTTGAIDANGNTGTAGAIYSRYTTWSNPTGSTTQRQVTVEVTWSDLSGASHSVRASRIQDLQ